MKNLLFICFIAAGFILATSCTKTDNRELNMPSITTVAATITAGQVSAGGNIPTDGGSIITEAGICYDTISNVTIAKNKTVVAHTFGGPFSAVLDKAKMGKTYYYRAYATNAIGTTYGTEMSIYVPIAINGFTKSSQVAPSNLVGYWAFENSYIDSVSNTVGTGVNTTFVPGVKGKAMQGGANGYMISNMTTAVKNLQSFTISFWLYTSNTNNGLITPICFSRTDQFWGAFDMFYENGGRTATTANLKVHVNAQSEAWFTNGWITNPWDTWVPIELTYDAATSTFTLYQNGAPVASTIASGLGNLVFPATATNIIFGTEQFQCTPSLGTAGGHQDWASYLTGKLDQVRIYNKALSVLELQALAGLEKYGL